MNASIDILYTVIYSLSHAVMVLISENAADYIDYINMYEPIHYDLSCQINSECFFALMIETSSIPL